MERRTFLTAAAATLAASRLGAAEQRLPIKKAVYLPRGINAVQLLFKKHFKSFADQYENKYAVIYGCRFRVELITEVVEKFIRCADYSQGTARIQCTNSDCRYEYFRPFSCKGFYFCPSCSQKRTLQFSEYMKGRSLLSLTHRQFVFTFPKLLKPYFHHNRRLFSGISRLIFIIIKRSTTRQQEGRSRPGWYWRISQQANIRSLIPSITASYWRVLSMREADLYIFPLGIFKE